MSVPATRAEFIDYCKRQLGWPVIRLNLDDDQVSDRVDYAIRRWQEYHFDGVEKVYLKHEITADDVTNKFIPVTDNLIIGITRLFPISNTVISMFDVRYQVRLNDFYNFNNTSMIHYYMTRNHLELLEFLFNTVPAIRFNRNDRRIFIEGDWNAELQAGAILVFECFRAVDPNVASLVWSDMWLQDFTTALLKRQWGTNLKKFGQVPIPGGPGGTVLNGQQIYDEGAAEVKTLDEQLRSANELPIDFFTG